MHTPPTTSAHRTPCAKARTVMKTNIGNASWCAIPISSAVSATSTANSDQNARSRPVHTVGNARRYTTQKTGTMR